MVIAPKCDRCGKELTEFGAILLSPPNNKSEVHKFHICVSCYTQIISDFGSLNISEDLSS